MFASPSGQRKIGAPNKGSQGVKVKGFRNNGEKGGAEEGQRDRFEPETERSPGLRREEKTCEGQCKW